MNRVLDGGERILEPDANSNDPNDSDETASVGAVTTFSSAIRPWILLGGAITCEVIAAYFMKRSKGMRNVSATCFAFAVSCLNVALTIFCLRTISLGVAWAVYTAFEMTATVVMAFTVFHEVLTWGKLIGLVLSSVKL
jgi:Membrane transporters of cations and cationic drugs